MPCRIAKTARVDPRAKLDEEARDRPRRASSVPRCRSAAGTRLTSHVCLMGVVKLGEYNTIRPFVAIGGTPQDVSYRDSPTCVEIGDHNTIAERVTIHRGTEKEDGMTRIGSHNHFQDGVHIAHDCKLGDRISIGIGSMLGGHVHVASDVVVMEKVGVHQYVTVGERLLHPRPLEDHPGRPLLHARRGKPAGRPGHQRPDAQGEGLRQQGPRRAPGGPPADLSSSR